MVDGIYIPGAWRLYARSVAFVLAVLFAMGAIGHAIPAALPWMLWLTPGFSLLTGVLVATPSVVAGGWRFVAWMAAAYAFAFLIEVAGVASGAIFGDYSFGPTLGWSWRGVPWLAGFNWVMVLNGAVCIAARGVPAGAGIARKPLIMLLAGLIVAGFDFLMEPVAVRLDYWHWTDGVISPQSYVACGAFAAMFAAIHPRQLRASCDLGTNGRLAGIYVLMQAAFFIALRVVWRLQAP